MKEGKDNMLGKTEAIAFKMTAKVLRMTVLGALVVFLSAACDRIQGTDPGWTELWSEQPVRFRSDIAAPTTKATGPLPNGTHFGVFGFYQPGTDDEHPGTWSALSPKVPNFMFNEEVTYDGDNYTYAPVKYWPNNTYNTLTFWAYCPYSAAPVLYVSGSSTPYTNTSSGIPDIGFTVTNGQTDLMISNRVENQAKHNINTPVTFTFSHALSKISFYVKKVDAAVPEKYTVKLKNIRFDGIYLTAIHRNAGWAEWALPRGTVAAFAPADASGYSTLTTAYPAAGSPQVVSMVLPQNLSYEYAMLHIEYTIDFEGLLNTRTMVSNIPLSTVFEDASSRWDQGKEYKVNISITPDDPIEFSVTWSNWGDVHSIHISS